MNKLKDIDWEQVLAIHTYALSHGQGPSWKIAFNRLRDAWFTRLSIPSNKSAEFVLFRSLDRADYKMLFELIAGTVNAEKVVVQDYKPRSKIPDWRYFLTVFLHLPLIAEFKGYSLARRLYLYLQACPYIAVLKVIRKIGINKIVLFSDMQPADNLLAQYFRDRVTITLQHGLYVDYGDFETINRINYLNQPSRYFLAWGQDTANLIKRYHPDHIVEICGKPNLEEVSSNVRQGSDRYFSVIFDQNMFHEYNLRLLDIAYQVAEQTGQTINLRLHPWNDPADYPIKDEVLRDQPLVDSRFVIGHTTSMIYEMLRVGVAAFKLRSKEYALQTPDSLQFATVEDLIALQNQEMRPDQIRNIGMNYIDSCGLDSLQKYRSFFDRLASMS